MSLESEIMVEYGMQGRLRGAVARTILEFLKEEMDGPDRMVRRKSLKERLGLSGISCCGATWLASAAEPSLIDDDHEEDGVVVISMEPTTPDIGPTPGRSVMNLATALAAEREFREAEELTDRQFGLGQSPSEGPLEPNSTAPATPRRVSLMKLLEETKEETKVVVGNDSMCCVCMVRKKGAAFIPCGHTFCRVCSRELWLNRGTCPLCNRSIIEILDIF